ncbi:uncharacterized protein METZ01_LOCUS487337, partial [marine metagenome]
MYLVTYYIRVDFSMQSYDQLSERKSGAG